MGYYVQHKIYLKDKSRDKLELLQDLLEQYNEGMTIETDIVYDDDGESVETLCLSDATSNFGLGTTWYPFERNMEDISELFNEKYPDETIYVYTKSEDGFEETYRFEDGGYDSHRVTHFRQELDKVCKNLNAKGDSACGGLFSVRKIAGHPTVRFHDGAYTVIDWNYFELYGQSYNGSYTTESPKTIHHSSRNYNSLEDRARAMKILYDYIVKHRSEFC